MATPNERQKFPASGGDWTRGPDGALKQTDKPTAPSPGKRALKAARKPVAKKATAHSEKANG